MNKKIIILFIAFSTIWMASAQPVLEINQKAQQLSFDALGNLYLINEGELLKYSASGELLNRFSQSLYGNIHAIDVTNALQVLVFYKEAGLVSFLNRELAELSDPYDIYTVIGSDVSHVCASSSGGFWAYSPEQQKLYRVSDQRKILAETQPLNDWIGNSSVRGIYEYNQKLYVNCQNKLLVFDLFGAYLSTIHRTNIQRLFFSEKQLIVYDGNLLYQMQAPFLKQQDKFFTLPNTGKDLAWSRSLIAIINGDKVLVYNTK